MPLGAVDFSASNAQAFLKRNLAQIDASGTLRDQWAIK